MLDVSGPVERTGKARGTDLLDGTVTLPLILARERDAELAAVDLRVARAVPEQAEELCERIAATGALAEASERALALVAEAKAALPASLPGRPRGAAGAGGRRGGRALLAERARLSRARRRRLEVRRDDQVGVEGADEELDLVLHVRLGQLLRSLSSALVARSSCSSSSSTTACSKTPSRRASHSGQRSTIRQWRGPSSDQSSGYDELAGAVEADVQRIGGDDRRRGSAGGMLVAIDDVDLLAAGQLHAMAGVVFGRVMSRIHRPPRAPPLDAPVAGGLRSAVALDLPTAR